MADPKDRSSGTRQSVAFDACLFAKTRESRPGSRRMKILLNFARCKLAPLNRRYEANIDLRFRPIRRRITKAEFFRSAHCANQSEPVPQLLDSLKVRLHNLYTSHRESDGFRIINMRAVE